MTSGFLFGLSIVQETKLGNTRGEPVEGEIINSIWNIWSLRILHTSRGSPMYVVSTVKPGKVIGARGIVWGVGVGVI